MSPTQMPDQTAVPQDTLPGEADGIGLTVLDAVEVGGTWTVIGSAGPPEAPEPERRRRRRGLAWWLGGAAVGLGLLLLLTLGLGQLLAGPGQTGPDRLAVPAAPGTIAGPPDTALPATVPPAAPAMKPDAHAATPTPVAGPSARPTDGATPTPSPSPSENPTPTPIPTVNVSVTPLPPTTAPTIPPV